jgi:hypothetical protein
MILPLVSPRFHQRVQLVSFNDETFNWIRKRLVEPELISNKILKSFSRQEIKSERKLRCGTPNSHLQDATQLTVTQTEIVAQVFLLVLESIYHLVVIISHPIFTISPNDHDYSCNRYLMFPQTLHQVSISSV